MFLTRQLLLPLLLIAELLHRAAGDPFAGSYTVRWRRLERSAILDMRFARVDNPLEAPTSASPQTVRQQVATLTGYRNFVGLTRVQSKLLEGPYDLSTLHEITFYAFVHYLDVPDSELHRMLSAEVTSDWKFFLEGKS